MMLLDKVLSLFRDNDDRPRAMIYIDTRTLDRVIDSSIVTRKGKSTALQNYILDVTSGRITDIEVLVNTGRTYIKFPIDDMGTEELDDVIDTIKDTPLEVKSVNLLDE